MKHLLILPMLIFSACYGQQIKSLKSSDWNPYEFIPTDTIYRYYVEVDSFLIQYIHSGSYMSTLVGRMICDIDSTRMDTMRVIDASTGVESDRITPSLKNCREDTAAYRRERHFYSHIQCYSINNGQKTPIGNKMFGYYVEAGCYEDAPKSWIDRAKKESKK